MDQIKKSAPACESCLEENLDMLENNKFEEIGQCDRCFNWDFKSYDQTKFKPPENYPERFLNHIDHVNFDKCVYLYPKEITFKMLQDLPKLVYEDKMKEKTAKAFLMTFGLNEETIGKIMKSVHKKIDYDMADVEKEIDPENWREVKKQKEENPEEFELYMNPKWLHPNVDLPIYLHQIDAPMHLLFYGIGKALMNKVNEFLTFRRKKTPFGDMMDKSLKRIKRMNLSWCKILLYKNGSFGGWVAENYLAFVKLMPWLYSIIDYFSEGEYKDPVKPFKEWKKDDLQMWLKMRGIQYIDGNDSMKVRLQEQVATLLEQEDGPPDILSVEGGNLKDLQNVIIAFNYMISLLMSDKFYLDDSHLNNIKLIIKVFFISLRENG